MESDTENVKIPDAESKAGNGEGESKEWHEPDLDEQAKEDATGDKQEDGAGEEELKCENCGTDEIDDPIDCPHIT